MLQCYNSVMENSLFNSNQMKVRIIKFKESFRDEPNESSYRKSFSFSKASVIQNLQNIYLIHFHEKLCISNSFQSIHFTSKNTMENLETPMHFFLLQWFKSSENFYANFKANFKL